MEKIEASLWGDINILLSVSSLLILAWSSSEKPDQDEAAIYILKGFKQIIGRLVHWVSLIHYPNKVTA